MLVVHVQSEGFMTVPAKSFQRWRLDVAPETTLAELCRQAGLKRTTLAQQLVRGKVSVSAVVAISRGIGLYPVNELSFFDRFSDVAAGVRAPTMVELLSQVSHLDVMAYLVQRSRASSGGSPEPQLGAFPHAASVRMWLEAIDRGDLRQAVANVSGVAPQNISAAVSVNRLSPHLAVVSARLAEVSLTSGLVVTGVLTPEEGGWASGGRSAALKQMSDGELVALTQGRLEEMAKAVRKHERDEERSREVCETLG
ncbi:hypothetical protein [Arthrobacter roseus]|uniref:hypothetical protein n=1 Tax=Arthrobacter roseus TaxID=136274 RepID=UPI001966382D|nr:hypothetical protein [Arthrobacter roseus]MBM7847320.1 hypothetical protein [Arthrobacter roseus]